MGKGWGSESEDIRGQVVKGEGRGCVRSDVRGCEE